MRPGRALTTQEITMSHSARSIARTQGALAFVPALLLAQTAFAGTFVYVSSGNNDPALYQSDIVTGNGTGPSTLDPGTIDASSLNGQVTAYASANDLTGIDRVLTAIDLGPTPGVPQGQSSVSASAAFSSGDLALFPAPAQGTASGLVHVTMSFAFDGTFALVNNTQGTFTGDLRATLDPLDAGAAVASHLDFLTLTPGSTPYAFGNGNYVVDENTPGAVAGTLSVGLDVAPGTPFMVTATLTGNIDVLHQDQAASGTIDGMHTGTLSLSAPSGYTLVSPSGAFGLPTTVAAVPEPGTWESLMAGLGIMGVALRRGHRRRA
ncbi:MAG: PEP-CTERM sorting domain-containing protein [Betaproteobacteria bacterium]|nr:PEP-CTERM sorting domain-containing protein [Betaproteobacteria bacterium]